LKLNIVLRDYVKVSSTSETIIFSDADFSLSFQSVDSKLLMRHWEIEFGKWSSMESMLNLKVASELISLGWISIEIDSSGIYLEKALDLNCFFLEFLSQEEATFNQSLIVKHLDSEVILLNHVQGTRIRIPLSLYLLSLEKKLTTHHVDLFLKLGILTIQQYESDLMNSVCGALNILQLNSDPDGVNTQHDLSKAMPPQSDLKLRDESFVRLLKNRKSSQKEISGIPTIQELEEFLVNVSGAHGKWNYPAAGGLYSTYLLIEIPDKGFFKFDSNSAKLMFITNTLSQPCSFIKILLITDQKRLRKKYKNFFYRLGLLDSGVILHQLSMVTALFGWQGRPIGWTNETVLRKIYTSLLTNDDFVTGEFHVATT
jgi:hypothetical protein